MIEFKDKNTFYCNECHEKITQEQFKRTYDKYIKPLCEPCEKDVKVPKGSGLAFKLCRALQEYRVIPTNEHRIGKQHVDIAITGDGIIIEVDGKHHSSDAEQALKDLWRTYFNFKKAGYITLRVPNVLLKKANFDKTVNCIITFLNENLAQLEEEEFFDEN